MSHNVRFSCYLPYAGWFHLLHNLKLVLHFHGFQQYTFQCQVLVVYPSTFLLIALVDHYDIDLLPQAELLMLRRLTLHLIYLPEDHMMYSVFYHSCQHHNKMYHRIMIPDQSCHFYQMTIHLYRL